MLLHTRSNDDEKNQMSEQKKNGRERLRRSMHFVPGANEKMLTKSLETEADGLILDLEDAVTPDRKKESRNVIAGWLREINFGRKERTIRINPLDTPWGYPDLRETMIHPPDAYVIPKPNSLEDVLRIDNELTMLEREYGHAHQGVGLILIATETARGALNIESFGSCPRVVAMSWGAEDLSADLGASGNRGLDGNYLSVYEHCRHQTLLSAVASRVPPIDTVYVDLRDADGLRKDCLQGAALGFTGKMTIHPDQIPIVNEIYTASLADVEEAKALLEAFEDAQKQGLMAFSFKGQMVDAPHLNRAKSLIQRARHSGVSL